MIHSVCLCLSMLSLSISAKTTLETHVTTLHAFWTENGWRLPEEASGEEIMNAAARSLNLRRVFTSYEIEAGRWSQMKMSIRSAYVTPVNISMSKCAVYENDFLDLNLRESMRFECERGLAALRAYSVEDCLAKLDLNNRTVAERALQVCMTAHTDLPGQQQEKQCTDISKDLRERKLGIIRRTAHGIVRVVEIMLGLFAGYLAMNFYIVGVIVSMLTIASAGLVFLNPLGGLLVFSMMAPTSILSLVSGRTLMKASKYLIANNRKQNSTTVTK